MRKLLLANLLLLLASPAFACQADRPAFDPHTVAFVQMMFSHQQDDGEQPGREDPLLPNEVGAEPMRKFEPSFVVSDQCGMIVLVSGLAGWFALGIAVAIMERAKTKEPRSSNVSAAAPPP